MSTSNAQFVTDLYEGYLQRTPDDSGYAYWLGLINGGRTRSQMLLDFGGCTEFQTNVASLCVAFGGGGGLHYVLSDLQGSSRAVMNNNGSSSAVVARHDYLPFGEEIGSGIGSRSSSQNYNASDGNRWKYGMTERDATSGLDHAWFRKYENMSGRWTGPDPDGGSMAVSDPQSTNRYAYTHSDPLTFIDPTGLHFELNCHAEVKDISDTGGDPILRFTGREICELRWVDDTPYLPVGGDGGIGAPLGGLQKKYDRTKRKLLNKDLQKQKLKKKCADLLALSGKSIDEITAAINAQVPFDGPDSKGLTMLQAGLLGPVDPNLPPNQMSNAIAEVNQTVSAYFAANPSTTAATAYFRRDTINNVYYRSSGITDTGILHEALHSITGLGDIDLAGKLGLGTFGSAADASAAITKALKDNGCTKD